MSDFTAEAKIAAAKRRLGDLKAIHSRWYSGSMPAIDAISEMEHIAYSATLYLNGHEGRYLSKEPDPLQAHSEYRAHGGTLDFTAWQEKQDSTA